MDIKSQTINQTFDHLIDIARDEDMFPSDLEDALSDARNELLDLLREDS